MTWWPTPKMCLSSNLPADGRHKTKTIEWGPDGKFYMNMARITTTRRKRLRALLSGSTTRDGSGGRVFARGLRNTVGFGWDLTTGLMWGVDNQSDNLARAIHLIELNQIQDGGDYGYPFCVGNQEPNPIVGGSIAARPFRLCSISSAFRASRDGVLLGACGFVPGLLLGRAVRGPAQH